MTKFACICVMSSVVLLVTSCGKKSQKPERRLSLSPETIDLAGITFYLTHEQLSRRFNMLRCSSSEPMVEKCRWNTTREDRKGIFKGIDEVQLTLYRDSVQRISLYYSQMLDVEYSAFDKAVQAKYATIIGDLPLDTLKAEWTYDSLIVRFIPNKKKHWTGSMYTYTPVLEFEERILYKHWMDDVEKQKVRALY